MSVNEGETFVQGADAETAKRLLEAAEKAGLDPSVVRHDSAGGFVVPTELVESKSKTSPDKAPASTKKNQ